MEWYEVFVDFPEFDPQSNAPLVSTRLDEMYSWLIEQRPGIDYKRDLYDGTGITFRFSNPDLATLFKLTWAGR